MKEPKFFQELSKNSVLTFKDKKELVLNHRVRCIALYTQKVKILRELKQSQHGLLLTARDFKASADAYFETCNKLSDAEFQLHWLKTMSKSRAIKYALVYHWSFLR